ncbi:MAG: hypothetical protein M9916_11340 [Crocinitomicaceae bacterium]|nr:hypothetical protein [Crocinitomicaceae bacterium]
MKSNLDQNFKDAFEKYELPYNPKAWEAMNSKLDAIQSAPKAPNGSSTKWIGGISAAVVAVSVLIYAVVNTTTPNTPSTTQTSQNTATVASDNKLENNTVATSATTNQTNKSDVATNDIVAKPIENTVESTSNTASSTVANNNHNTTITTTKDNNNSTSNRAIETPISASEKNDATNNSAPANLFNELTDLCIGESATVKNKNAFALYITSPNGKETVVNANQSFKFMANESGSYTISSQKEKRTILVKDTPKLDFSINEDIKFEKGIPAIPLETLSDAQNFEWSFEGVSQKQYGEKATAHFYKRGNYSITLSAKNTDGCVGSVTKQVTIDENYNLLAPSGFMPKSDDPRKNRFIPIALTLRNTAFTMTIFDPRTGNVVFETNSIEGWDGIDRNTRQLVDENKSFAWKVVLAQPEQGEPKEYSGIITRL